MVYLLNTRSVDQTTVGKKSVDQTTVGKKKHIT
jgi:hypothetical protein